MKWTCSAVVLVFFGLSAFADDKAIPEGWKEYPPKDGAYTILIPDQKTGRTRQSDRSSTRGGVTTKTSTLSISGPTLTATMVSVTVSPLPKDSTPASRLEAARDNTAKALAGEASDEMKLKVDDKWDGLEFQVKGDKASVRVRVYDVDGVRYELTVTGSKDQITGKNADIFLGSFKLPMKKEKGDK
jgi:hypothetical protein